MKNKTTTYDMIRTIFLCLSNGLNKRKNQIYNVSEIANITNLDRTALIRHVAELEDLQIIDSFFVGNRKYYTLDNSIKQKLIKSGEEYLSNLMTQAQTSSESLNKDLTATQQVASPKSASQTSLNPDIQRNNFLPPQRK